MKSVSFHKSYWHDNFRKSDNFSLEENMLFFLVILFLKTYKKTISTTKLGRDEQFFHGDKNVSLCNNFVQMFEMLS